MLQAFVPIVSSVFQTYVLSAFIWILYMFHIYVCKCFIWMLRMLLQWFQVFSGVFASVSDACFKCFICLQTYVASVASECFKSRSDVASPSSPFATSPRCLLLFLALAGHPPPPPHLLDADDVRGGAGPMWVHKNGMGKGLQARASGCLVRPDVRALASL
jgi:hypothetical protein